MGLLHLVLLCSKRTRKAVVCWQRLFWGSLYGKQLKQTGSWPSLTQLLITMPALSLPFVPRHRLYRSLRSAPHFFLTRFGCVPIPSFRLGKRTDALNTAESGIGPCYNRGGEIECVCRPLLCRWCRESRGGRAPDTSSSSSLSYVERGLAATSLENK